MHAAHRRLDSAPFLCACRPARPTSHHDDLPHSSPGPHLHRSAFAAAPNGEPSFSSVLSRHAADARNTCHVLRSPHDHDPTGRGNVPSRIALRILDGNGWETTLLPDSPMQSRVFREYRHSEHRPAIALMSSIILADISDANKCVRQSPPCIAGRCVVSPHEFLQDLTASNPTALRHGQSPSDALLATRDVALSRDAYIALGLPRDNSSPRY